MPIEPYVTWKKTGLKICPKCLIQKKVTEFPWKKSRNAPAPWCSECQISYTREWSAKNKDSVEKSQERYRNNHRDKLRKKGRERGKVYYQKHKDQCDTRQAEYYQKNRERCIKATGEAARKAWFEIGDLVIHQFGLYEVIKRTRGGFRIEKRYPYKDDFYFDQLPQVLIRVRRSLRRYMKKHHKQNISIISVEIEERFIPKI